MKKVLFTATVDSHILQFHLPFLKLFKEKGYEVHVATNGNEKIPYCDIKHIVSFERSPLRLNNLKAIKQLKKICDNEKFDIIHTHTPMGSVVTRLAARKTRKSNNTRVIYTAHGFHFYKGAPILNWLVFYPVEKWLSKYTDTLILINKEDYSLAKRKFSRRCNNIEYVPGVGINVGKFCTQFSDTQKNNLKKELGIKDASYILTCVARLDKNKNQGFLINAMEKIIKDDKNVHLLLVGPDECNGIYKVMCNEKKLNDNIHFLGRREDVAEILSISNIVVSASMREGLPVNIIEALASSIPVVAMDCRGMHELIDQHENGYICKNESEFISSIEKIKTLNHNELLKMKKDNKEKSKKYDVSIILKLYEKIYFQSNRKGTHYDKQ